MTVDQLSLYNGALRVLGERRLANLTENTEPRRVLDDIWNDDIVRYCLEQGFWYFAMRTTKAEYDPGYTADFGHAYRFGKDDDYVNTASICSDEYFSSPLADYDDEDGYIYASISPIYFKFVSDGSDYGRNYVRWPKVFVDYVHKEMALRALPRITTSKAKKDDVESDRNKALSIAKSKEAMKQPPRFPPMGRFASARLGGSFTRDRRGSSLIG